MAKRRKTKQKRVRRYEFREDSRGASLLKTLHLTEYQRRRLTRWTLFGLVCLAGLVIQDVLMSRFSFLGATTDLVPMAILLISVAIGTEEGCLFALIASTAYFFSDSAPGAYAIAIVTVLGVGGALVRENFWRRGFASDVLCAGTAMMLYEIAVFGAGVFLGLTRWRRLGVFLLTGILSVLIMLPLYRVVSAIDRIGGQTWKE